jgi:peptidyl-prolyl cis-trans isomerase SurA
MGFMALLVIAGILSVAHPRVSIAQENVLRIAAVVNDDLISIFDLQNRLGIAALSAGLQLDQETQQRLLPQVMRTMIDEKLQLQAAADAGVRVTDREIEQAIDDLAGRNKMNADQLRDFLASRRIAPTAIRQQIEPQIAWSKYVQRRLRRDIRIGEDQVDEELARLDSVADEPQRRVYEIFLSVDDVERDDEVRQNSERLLSQVRNGASFDSLARNFSQSSTTTQGGDLGWVAAGQLEPQLNEVLIKLEPGMVSRPIRTVSGYYLLYVTDKRIEGVDPMDAKIDLAQMTVRPASNDADTRDLVRRELSQAVGSLNGCGDLDALSKQRDDASIAKAGGVRLGDLPDGVREAVSPLSKGNATAPIERGDSFVIVSVCEREEPKSNLPSRDAVGNRLLAERLDLRAQRELRDLRRAAFIDVRL